MIPSSSKLAIAVLNYKMPDLAANMIKQLEGGPHDVFLFDNGGNMGYDFPGVNVISWSKNLLFTRGWNRAMLFLQDYYDWVWMLNDDLRSVSQGIASGLLAWAPPVLAAITPAFNSPHRVFHPSPEWCRSNILLPIRPVRWVDWCCPLVNTMAWRDVGPFDKRFVGYGADLDWCHRARLKSWRFCVADFCAVHHIGSKTALHHGLQHVQGDVGKMNELLCEKWGVSDWTQLT